MQELRARIIQPEGVNYMIQNTFYTEAQAREYLDKLICSIKDYLDKRSRGVMVARHRTVDEMLDIYENLTKMKIVTFERKEG